MTDPRTVLARLVLLVADLIVWALIVGTAIGLARIVLR